MLGIGIDGPPEAVQEILSGLAEAHPGPTPTNPQAMLEITTTGIPPPVLVTPPLSMVSGVVEPFYYEAADLTVHTSGPFQPGQIITADSLNNAFKTMDDRLKEVETELHHLKNHIVKELHEIKMHMRWDDLTEGTNE